MRMFAFTLLAALAVPAAAQQREINYPAGSLGFSAIQKADYATAERQIRGSGLSKYDPGRALNLGYVFLKTDRPDRAAKQFMRVLVEEPVELILADGSTINSHDAAARGLSLLKVQR